MPSGTSPLGQRSMLATANRHTVGWDARLTEQTKQIHSGAEVTKVRNELQIMNLGGSATRIRGVLEAEETWR